MTDSTLYLHLSNDNVNYSLRLCSCAVDEGEEIDTNSTCKPATVRSVWVRGCSICREYVMNFVDHGYFVCNKPGMSFNILRIMSLIREISKVSENNGYCPQSRNFLPLK